MTYRDFSWRVVTAAAISIALLVLTLLIGRLASALLIAFAGVLVAMLLRALAAPLSRWLGLPDVASTLLTAVLFLAIVGGIGWIGGASILEQSRELSRGLSDSREAIENGIGSTVFGRFLLDNMPLTGDEPDALWLRFEDASKGAFLALTTLLLALAVGLFLAVRPRLYTGGFLQLVPIAKRGRGAEVLASVQVALSGWLLGQGISMLFLWLSTWLFLHLLGVPLAFILSVLTGVLAFVPYLGPLLALLPIALVALAESPALALWATIGYIVLQTVEGNLVNPLVLQRTVRLPPALTLLAQVIMGGLMGIGGVVLASPLLAVLMVLIQRLYVEDLLGDVPNPVRGERAENPPPPTRNTRK